MMGIWMIVFSGSVPLGALWTGRAAQPWGVTLVMGLSAGHLRRRRDPGATVGRPRAAVPIGGQSTADDHGRRWPSGAIRTREA